MEAWKNSQSIDNEVTESERQFRWTRTPPPYEKWQNDAMLGSIMHGIRYEGISFSRPGGKLP